MSLQAELLRLSLKAFKVMKAARKQRNISMEKMRRRLSLIEPVVPRPPAGTKTTVIDVAGITAVETLVRQAHTDRCVLYFHGGGYTFGAEPLVRDFTWRLGAATGASVLYFDYRLAPEHPFPAAVEDAGKVYRWLAGRMNPAQIAFVGDSSGGGLLLATLYKMRDEGFKLPSAAVAISPWTDLALTGSSLRTNAKSDPIMDVKRLPAFAKQYLGGADPQHPYASPLYGDASGLPPVLIQVGSDEILRDDAVRMAERLREAGGAVELEEWLRMPHVWHHFARLIPEGRRAIERIGEFVRKNGYSRPGASLSDSSSLLSAESIMPISVASHLTHSSL
jgi:epsilon-lactone hydrolase